jgi:peptide chain release factor subunit 1
MSPEDTSLKDKLDQLAAFEPTPLPVISLYLNTEAGQNGKGQFEQFVRKEFPLRAKTYSPRSPERESFDQDYERIKAYLKRELQPSVNGLALFACSAKDSFFDAIQFEAPMQQHRLFVSNQPHLYPLARLHDQYRRYAAVLIDSQHAHLFVFGLGRLLAKEELTGTKTNRTATGGWSQARYQRHVDNFHLQHYKEVVEALDRLAKDEELDKIVLAGDEVIVAVFREQLPAHLSEKIVDVLRIDMKTPENEVFNATLEAMRQDDAKNDVEKVERLFNEFRSAGLGVVGAQDTLSALNNGQVDELILSAARKEIRSEQQDTEESPVGEGEQPPILADSLVTAAHQTSAKVTFIEDPTLLKEVGGVGALLRYRL